MRWTSRRAALGPDPGQRQHAPEREATKESQGHRASRSIGYLRVRPADSCDRARPGLGRGRCTAVVRHRRTIARGYLIQPLRGGPAPAADRVLIQDRVDLEGIPCGEVLEREGIHCNLTLPFGMHQAVACARGRRDAISPFVGRILDWYKKAEAAMATHRQKTPASCRSPNIYNYLQAPRLQDRGHGGQLPHLDEIIELAGCDSSDRPNLLLELARGPARWSESSTRRSPRRLRSPSSRSTKPGFAGTRGRPEATDKLAEGIAGVRQADIALEKLLAERYRRDAGQRSRPARPPTTSSRRSISTATASSRARSGAGTDAVFLALDADATARSPRRDGRGVGAALSSRRERGERGHATGRGPPG